MNNTDDKNNRIALANMFFKTVPAKQIFAVMYLLADELKIDADKLSIALLKVCDEVCDTKPR